ncbi:uncharacterized protein LOC126998349 [Eriocheir sinensis]|uniref:uncharacterized protein LOC126998349 n=1 Tax=Eriocheir sinensis TaxID=95602 RepID=UPI0021CA1A6B|nr:uncharacterized protein LOC126998349 [Eriocheir sinensis]
MHLKLFFTQCSTSAATICRSVFSKKNKQCEDVESSQESKGKDQKASGTSEQDAELPFVQANLFMFSIASCFGFHNVRRSSGGAWEVSRWRVVPVVVHLAISVAGFLVVIYLIFFCNLKYYQGVMIMPITFGMSFCIGEYISSFSISKHYIKYLSTIEAQDVKMKPYTNMAFVATGTFVSSTIYTACSLLVTNLSQENIFILMVPVFTTTYLPTVLDMHMFSFTLMLKQQVVKLRRRIRRVNQWTREEVSGVARQWLLLCRLFRIHNRVRLPFFLSRQVFRKSLYSRLMMAMVQVMAFTFAAVMIDFMMDELKTQTSPTIVVLSVLVPLIWTDARSLGLSLNGEVINHAVSVNTLLCTPLPPLTYS